MLAVAALGGAILVVAIRVSGSDIFTRRASAFEKKKALPKEGSLVVLRDIAGARFVSRYHRTRIRETSRHPS
jgi:hypothetical protein